MPQDTLFDLPPSSGRKTPRFGGLRYPLWTENKAKLVAEYLRLFVAITKHGCYIDGFAGPKQVTLPDTWAAELVLRHEPRFLTDFFLVDKSLSKIGALTGLKAEHQSKSRRVHVYRGDFNSVINRILASGHVRERKATFCLIDQFGSQCRWETVRKLAEFKKEHKIEIFYFLASGWLDRMLEGFTRNHEIPEAWWGNADWRSLRGMKNPERAQLFANRFRVELGYRFAHPWPIYDRGDTGRVMFHMIHASDHADAPELMRRAYVRVTKPRGAGEQLVLL